MRRIDLVDLLMLTPSGVTRLLEGLEAAGLVENVTARTTPGSPGRRLTDEGTRHARLRRRQPRRAPAPLFRGALDEDEVAQLTELLGRLPGVGDGSCVASD